MRTRKIKVKRETIILDFEMEVFKFMENEKVKYLIDMTNDMDIKDKLRLAICMSKVNCLVLYIILKKIMRNLIVC